MSGFLGAAEALAQVHASATSWAESSPSHRAGALRAVAGRLEHERDALVRLAMSETGLGSGRLDGEVSRTAGQLRLFADLLDSGEWRRVVLDPAQPGETGRPELLRFQQAMGPALVFAGGNFPFAFSVLGGDTAAALAAGCPVVLKVHPGHPQTSVRTAQVAHEALREVGADPRILALVAGEGDGVDVLRDERIKVASFTGSLAGGTALARIAADRPTPIPFFGELGSINPVVVLPEAARRRAAEITRGFVDSFTLGVGQFCTKPGLFFVPLGSEISVRARELVEGLGTGRMLTARIAQGHEVVRDRLLDLPGVEVLATAGADGEAHPFDSRTMLLRVSIDDFVQQHAALSEECFGPTSVLVEYDGVDDVLPALAALEGSLTAAVHADDGDLAASRRIVEIMRERVGRVVWNGWPTGVAVSPAMQHGGPFPASTDLRTTSVGSAAIERFCRPVCFQGVPPVMLPDDVRARRDDIIGRGR